jgi:sugar phosphate isomerase/epimerase
MGKKRVWIGNQTARSAARPLDPFDYAVQEGFDAFEWFLDAQGTRGGWAEVDLNGEERRELRRRAREHDIRLSVHAPWWIDPVEASGYEQLLRCLDFTLDVGAANLNLHLVRKHGIEAFVRALDPFVRGLIDLPLQVSIENVPDTGPEDFNELFARLGRTSLRIEGALGMCLDLGHANLYPPFRNDYLGFIDRLDAAVPIVHLHLHENYGDDDSHLPLFTGPSGKDGLGIQGFVERMKGRGFSGSVILEQWPDPPSLLNRARDRLARMFASDPMDARGQGAFLKP